MPHDLISGLTSDLTPSGSGGLAPTRPATPSDPVRTDRISLRGIAATGHHGVFDFERRDGQTFVVDLVCHLDLSRAGATDDLADTLDYGALAQAVADEIGGDPVDLIEALAARIAARVLRDPRVGTVEVTVHKPRAPMPVPVADTAVTVVRSRPQTEPETAGGAL